MQFCWGSDTIIFPFILHLLNFYTLACLWGEIAASKTFSTELRQADISTFANIIMKSLVQISVQCVLYYIFFPYKKDFSLCIQPCVWNFSSPPTYFQDTLGIGKGWSEKAGWGLHKKKDTALIAQPLPLSCRCWPLLWMLCCYTPTIGHRIYLIDVAEKKVIQIMGFSWAQLITSPLDSVSWVSFIHPHSFLTPIFL